MRRRNRHLLPTLPRATDLVLHNSDPARKAILITQPFADPLQYALLLLWLLFVLVQNAVDDTDERIELETDRR